MPFLMGQNLYLDSEKLQADDCIEPAMKHGTLSVGFIGLAEALTALIGNTKARAQRRKNWAKKLLPLCASKSTTSLNNII